MSRRLFVLVLCAATAAAEPITDFSVFAGGNVDLGRSTVKSGLTGAVGNIQSDNSGGPAGALDGIRVGGNATMGRFFTTNGNIVAGGNISTSIGGTFGPTSELFAGGTITLNPSALTAPLSQTPGILPVPFTAGSAFMLPVLPTPTVFSSGGVDHEVIVGGTLSLAPGSYGDITLRNNSTLNLSAGDYFFDEIFANNTVTLNLDLTGGPINIFVTGDFTADNTFTVVPTGGTAADIYYEVHGRFDLNNTATVHGTVYTTEAVVGDITSDNNGMFFGALWARDFIQFENGSMVNFVLNNRFRPMDQNGVPEPGAALLLACGLAVFVTVRGRRRLRSPE